jgi:hypothetical protein
MKKKTRCLRAKLIVLRHGLKVANTHEKKVIKRLSFIDTIKQLVNIEELVDKTKTKKKLKKELKLFNHRY